MEPHFIILQEWVSSNYVRSNIKRAKDVITFDHHKFGRLLIMRKKDCKINKKYLIFDLNYFKSEKEKYKWLSENYDSITYNYEKIKETFRKLNKEIIEKYYHPNNIDKWIDEINE